MHIQAHDKSTDNWGKYEKDSLDRSSHGYPLIYGKNKESGRVLVPRNKGGSSSVGRVVGAVFVVIGIMGVALALRRK